MIKNNYETCNHDQDEFYMNKIGHSLESYNKNQEQLSLEHIRNSVMNANNDKVTNNFNKLL